MLTPDDVQSLRPKFIDVSGEATCVVETRYGPVKMRIKEIDFCGLGPKNT
jgi:hypothetical protein